jgi:hypothetical protein
MYPDPSLMSKNFILPHSDKSSFRSVVSAFVDTLPMKSLVILKYFNDIYKLFKLNFIFVKNFSYENIIEKIIFNRNIFL